MIQRPSKKGFFFVFFVIISFALARGQIIQEKCIICHGKRDIEKTAKRLFIDQELIYKSVHKEKNCVDCHYDVTEIPHREGPLIVKCQHCHYEGNPEEAPQSDVYLEYQESVHGLSVAQENAKAPLCQNCHGSHLILHTEVDDSRVGRKNVAQTCGECHVDIYAKFINSIHGQAAYAKNIPDAPTCTDCHGEHTIRKYENPASSVSKSNIVKTCSECHSAEAIVGKYGITTEQVKSFEESFHGLAVDFGSKKAANCASCHTPHDIRPSSDPLSSININNIPETCGKCHPGANANFAKGKMHVNPKSKDSGIIFWVAFFFKYFTIAILGGLFVHIILDVYRKIRLKKAK
ncbi:hypothetical protein ACFLRM_05500 [Acidobacteriota bacterium]